YKFDIIFADPPYDIEKNINNIVKYVSDNFWLKENGILIIEHHKKTVLEESFEDLKLVHEKRIGETSFSYFSYKGE
ncbi:MAG TPA: RsmD family RNA methyltransferase, partial [Dictyoglomaceae bacterium]|nr:RsmD family RNA methyltransferase [Dictyoglomaceae bacterium]